MKSNEPYWDALQELEAEERTTGFLKNILHSLLCVILLPLVSRQLVPSTARAAFSGKVRTKGVCHHLRLGDCRLLSGGRICRRSNRLTRYCAFKDGFALRKNGTVSTRLTDEAYRALLYYLSGMRPKE